MSDTPVSGLSPELAAACTNRIDRLRAALPDAGIDGLVVNAEVDIRYLTGFVGHDSLLLVTADRSTIISDARYDEFLDPWRESGVVDIVMGVRHRLEASVAGLCGSGGLARIGVQAEHMTLAGRARLAEALGRMKLIETTGLVATLRMCKDELEVATIERAIRCQQQAIGAALDKLTLGMTELELSALLEFEMRSRGAFRSSFDAIVGAGANSSVIHYQTGSAAIGPGVLLIDWGAEIDGYCGDLTRTFGVGEMPAALRDIYMVVLEAQLAAIEACQPGRVCADVDAVARQIITAAGHGEHFGHGLGHGLGMEVHEAPYFNDLSTDVELKPGMVMTVEPGIYVPGVGGVRIEDDVLITPDGHRVLSDWPKGLDDAVIEPVGGVSRAGAAT